MDLKVAIVITDELSDEVITANGMLDLASGEIRRIEYQDYDVEARGYPFESDDYEFTSGMLSSDGKDVEFSIEVNRTSGSYSVSPNELLEIKVRAAALFAGMSGQELLANAGLAPAGKTAAPRAPAKKAPAGKSGNKPRGGGRPPGGGRFH